MPAKTSIYLDTSVINFLFATDVPELRSITNILFKDFIYTGVYHAFISDVVIQEINNTTEEAKKNQLLAVIYDYKLDFADLGNIQDIENLADLYIQRKIIPVNKRADALHIAITVVNNFNYLVSWNYQHLANVNRERKVLAVNYENNYLHPIRILTPFELIDFEIEKF